MGNIRDEGPSKSSTESAMKTQPIPRFLYFVVLLVRIGEIVQ